MTAQQPEDHIKNPYTLAEIKTKIASNDYNAEMLLQHAMRLLDGAAISANVGEPTQEFEKWLATYSTLSAARDVNGYADLTTEMLWHAWQAAAKTKAPEGTSAEWIDANARPGFALTNYACAHDFSVQPSSGIRLCQKCWISETAARKAAPQEAPAAQGDVLESEYQRGYRQGYEQRDAEVRGALV